MAGDYVIVASAPGYHGAISDPISVVAGADVRPITLRLERAEQLLHGMVEDVGGGPIVGAIVTVRPEDWTARSLSLRHPLKAVTDAEGRYRIGIRPGHYRAQAVSPGYVSETQLVNVATADRRMDFSLYPAGAIQGRVLSAATGEPVPGLIVTSNRQQRTPAVSSGDDADRATAVADGEGRFTLDGLRAGVHVVRAGGHGYASKDGQAVRIAIGETAVDILLYVERGLSISGRVVSRRDPSEGIAGARVRASGAAATSVEADTITAGDGSFTLHGLLPGQYDLVAESATSAPVLAHRPVTMKNDNLEGVQLELDPGLTIRGRVVPPTDAHVALQARPQDMHADHIATVFLSEQMSVRANPDTGEFELPGVAPGRWAVVAQTRDARRGQTELSLGSADVDGVEIRLEPAASVSGRVVDEDGNPMPTVTVRLRPDRAPAGFEVMLWDLRRLADVDGVPADSDGRFSFPTIEPGDYYPMVFDRVSLLWSTGPSLDPKTSRARKLTLAPGEQRTGYTVVVEGLNKTISGRVVDANGEGVADVAVYAHLVGSHTHGGTRYQRITNASPEPPVLTDADGSFTVPRLRRGDYDIVAESAALDASAEQPRVSAGSTITLTLQQRGELQGRVSSETATRCDITLTGPVERATTAFGAGCPFKFTSLDPGTYNIQVSTDEGVGRITIDITSAKATTTEVPLEAWATIRGRLVAADTGHPLEGYQVLAANTTGPEMHRASINLLTGDILKVGPDGRFHIEGLTPGKVGIAIFRPGDLSNPIHRQQVHVAAGTDLDLSDLPVAQEK